MDLLGYWKWETYIEDTNDLRTFPYHFNSNKDAIHTKIQPGETLWLVVGRKAEWDFDYFLAARLIAERKELNRPGYAYGQYRLVGDRTHSVYYDPRPGAPSITPILYELGFQTLQTANDSPKHRYCPDPDLAKPLQIPRTFTLNCIDSGW